MNGQSQMQRVPDRRGLRAITGYLVVGFVLALAAMVLGPAGSGIPGAVAVDPSRGSPGPCPDDSGVTVVVDFQELGPHGGRPGGVIVRCAQGNNMTGLDALYQAGFEVAGTNRWGQGFICRLEGRPAVDEPLAIAGNPGYTEPCVDTPPAQAFWSYWHAENGGPWVFSQFGVKNRSAPSGTFEGWSFSLNASETNNPTPRFTPQREAEPAPTDPGPVQGGDDGPPEGDGAGGSTGGSGTVGGAGGGDDGEGSGDAGPPGDSSGDAAGQPFAGDRPDEDPGSEESEAGAGGPAADAAPPLPRVDGEAPDGSSSADRAGMDGAVVTEGPTWSGGEEAAGAADGGEQGMPVGVLVTLVILILLGALVLVTTRRRRTAQ